MKKALLIVFTLFFLTVNVALAAIDINKADAKKLTTLPGIGEAKAAAIVKYRKENGNFQSAKDLIKVKGIGPKVFEKLSKEISIK